MFLIQSQRFSEVLFRLGSNIRRKIGSAYMLRVCIVLIGVAVVFSGCRGKKKRWALFSRGKTERSTKLSKKQSKQVEKLISIARSYTGTPHVMGGTSRNGMDCSGLMLVAFNGIGQQIPRTAKEQYASGKPIEQKDLEPGDLVFFSDPKVGKGITHVGLVTFVSAEGKVRFIHVSSKLGVMESHLSDSYFAKYYSGGRRILFTENN